MKKRVAASNERRVQVTKPQDYLSRLKQLLTAQGSIRSRSSWSSDLHLFLTTPYEPPPFSRRCSECGELEEEVEVSSDGRIFLSYCGSESASTDESGWDYRHVRVRRREIVWDPNGKEFVFPRDLSSSLLDPVFDAAFGVISSVDKAVGGVLKGALWFMYCRCSSPDPDHEHPHYDDYGGCSYMCRRCGNWID